MLAVVYLIYNAGVDDPDRAVLRGDTIRLGRSLVVLMPDEPEVVFAELALIAGNFDSYHLVHAARDSMLRRMAKPMAAKSAYERDVELDSTIRPG